MCLVSRLGHFRVWQVATLATLKESTLESRLFFFPEKESRVDDSQKFESRARSNCVEVSLRQLRVPF